eukprot:7176-Chlamydomonas_euryale.AAC.1
MCRFTSGSDVACRRDVRTPWPQHDARSPRTYACRAEQRDNHVWDLMSHACDHAPPSLQHRGCGRRPRGGAARAAHLHGSTHPVWKLKHRLQTVQQLLDSHQLPRLVVTRPQPLRQAAALGSHVVCRRARWCGSVVRLQYGTPCVRPHKHGLAKGSEKTEGGRASGTDNTVCTACIVYTAHT